ncbi:MAG: ATP-binding protein [Candidatus Bathyarchaeota archaeon]|nr:ATP-binding protein [Gammaproteobacteria bacterium]MCL5877392.1 ATP-binding protein [Candidatus Bathyarchaeota archaeon]
MSGSSAAADRNAMLASFPILNPSPIIEADFEGNLLFANPAAQIRFARLRGNSAAHPIFRNWREIVDTIIEEKVKHFQREIEIEGSWFIQQIFLIPSSQKIRIYFTPINELKKAQHALEKERNLLRSVMNGAKNIHLVYLDRDFNFVRVNDAYAKTCGYTPEEMVGKNHFDLYPHAENEAIFNKARDTGVPVEFRDKPFVFPDQPERGTTYWDWTLEPIKDGTGKVEGLVLSLVETTERKRVQRKLEEYACQMEELARQRARELSNSERLVAIGQTAGMVGHDIRNPLQAIAGELYLAKEELAALPDSESKKYLQESISSIEQNLFYIDKIVADLQDFTKPLNPNKEKIVIDKAIEEALLIVNIPSNLAVNLATERCEPFYADMQMLKRILINLIQNAVQAMPDGGTLKIQATCQNSQVHISVQDTGEGIPEEIQAKLFTPLFTTKSKGQGFGLPVVKRLVEAQNGTVTYKTQTGKGTTFTVQLPQN